MAIGAAHPRLCYNIAAITAFPVLAYQHFAFFGVDHQQMLSALRAYLLGHVFVHIGRLAIGNRFDQSGRVSLDLFDKSTPIFFALADPFQPLFPARCEKRFLQIRRHKADQLHAFRRWNQRIPSLLYIKGTEQLFNDVRAGSRRSQSAADILLYPR